MRQGFIYKITNATNDKIYIGQTIKPVAKRWLEHVAASKRGQKYPINRAISKHGRDKFTIEMLACIPEDRLDDLETFYIAQYRSTEYKVGYNVTDGGVGIRGFKHSEATKAVMSAKQSGSNHHMFGKSHTPESLAKMSAASTGRSHTAEAKAKISAAHTGRTVSAEGRANMSKAFKGRTAHNKGKSPSAEVRLKMSISAKARRAREAAAKLAAQSS